MPRIRTIKPEHWGDKELPTISMQAHLLWIGMWNFSDDRGCIDSDPFFIKSQIFPRRTELRVEQIKQWLDQLVNARFIIPFVYESVGYYIHRTFEVHQRLEKPQPSKIPADVIAPLVGESGNVRGTLPLYSKGKERKVKDINFCFPHVGELFQKKFLEWVEFRKEKRKPLTQKSVDAQMEFLKNFDEITCITIIDNSIRNDWQGLFELKTSKNGSEGNRRINGTAKKDSGANELIGLLFANTTAGPGE